MFSQQTSISSDVQCTHNSVFSNPNPKLTNTTDNKKVLMVADVPGWVYDRTCHSFQKRFADSYSIDIGYLKPDNPDREWKKLLENNQYDVIWHLWHLALSRLPVELQIKLLRSDIRLIGSINRQLTSEELSEQFEAIRLWDFVTVNNRQTHKRLKEQGIDAAYTPNGIDFKHFFSSDSVTKRPFRVCFVASEKQKEHKGYSLWCEVKKQFENHPGIELVEAIIDSTNNHIAPLHENTAQQKMRELYTSCQIFVCLSKNEGGPNPLLESAACGCVPISTQVGYAPQLINAHTGFLIERTANACAEKIQWLYDHPAHLWRMSCNVRQNIQAWDLEKLVGRYRQVLTTATEPVPKRTLKKKILIVVDVEGWVFENLAQAYKKILGKIYDIDIGYQKTESSRHWETLEQNNHYDIIWLFHERSVISKLAGETLDEKALLFYRRCQAKATKVLISVHHLVERDYIEQYRKIFRGCDGMSINNIKGARNFWKQGIDCQYTPEWVDCQKFKIEVPVEQRPFRVLFVSSLIRLEHKGHEIFKQIKQRLAHKQIEFQEIITDSFHNKRSAEQMKEIYNQCSVYLCLSKNEGGPNPLLESAACGCVPISTDVGCAEQLIGRDQRHGFIVEREAESFIEKIEFLHDHPEQRYQKSQQIIQEVQKWDIRILVKNYQNFLSKID